MTSIEWLVEEMLSKGYFKESVTLTNIDHLQYKAEEMHKEEIIESYCNGCADITKDESIFPRETSEQYYQETFVSKGSDDHIVDTNEMIDQVPDVRKMVDDDVEKLELDYYKELEERREVAKNFQGQVAGRHPDMFGHSEMHHMVRGYVEGYNKAKETLYTEEQLDEKLRKAIEMARESMFEFNKKIPTSDEIIQSLKQPKKD